MTKDQIKRLQEKCQKDNSLPTELAHTLDALEEAYAENERLTGENIILRESNARAHECAEREKKARYQDRITWKQAEKSWIEDRDRWIDRHNAAQAKEEK